MNENIFAFDISEYELAKLGIKHRDEKNYLSSVTDKHRIYDLYVLLKLRNDKAADYLWDEVICNSFIVMSI